ncbi:UNVERIFIED_CONTAM: hypothetical protein Scaly_0256200 [Sesamum calycinum]|uniref:DUF4218 domain-containing protein n=1 Tax=Sesamum calycinum TaxID=2727403 RepID=A0AAW2SBB0_9LAMI
MHIEKNVLDNIFNTVMDIKGKTKNNLNARKDLKIICNQSELQDDDRRPKVMPKVVYIRNKKQKKRICKWITHLKFSDGYASNLARCIDMKELRLHGMKSYDCHILCLTMLDINKVQELEVSVVTILCKLEIFRPAFFDSMEHIIVHLPYEARVKSDLNYTDNELLKLHYWGPTDPMRGIKVNPRYHLVDVNFKKVHQKNEPFVLAKQVVQVHYTEYPSMKRDKMDWMVVCKTKVRRVINDSRWTKVAFQEDETIPSPQLVKDNHNYELHDTNGI